MSIVVTELRFLAYFLCDFMCNPIICEVRAGLLLWQRRLLVVVDAFKRRVSACPDRRAR